jgi:hypothetical protein
MIWALAMILAAPEADYTDLTQSMDPWERHGGDEGSVSLEDGVLTFSPSNYHPVALLTKEDYENFELEFDIRFQGWVESGLYIHAPRNGAYRAGLEVELESHLAGTTPHSMGAIFRILPPATSWEKRDGWHACRVTMDWPRLVVRINDRVLQDVDLSAHEELRHKLRRGAIGFQNQGWEFAVRNVRVKRLPDTENGIALFNGQDLTGWSLIEGDAEWEVRDGVLSVTRGSGYLAHETICQDFDLRLYVRTAPGANGGVFFRWSPTDNKDRGQEVQVFDYPGATMCTGSLYGVARANDLGITPGEWQLLQIVARGPKVVTYINGIKGAESDAVRAVRPGWIVLQAHRDGATLEHKDIVLVPAD